MKILALDAATEACSAALFAGDAVYERHEIAPRRHAELLLPMIDGVLTEAGRRLGELDAVAFGRGPGSFTGARLAAGVAQGLALGANLPVLPLSSLTVLAQGAAAKAPAVLAALDARMGEVYWACYRLDANGVAQALSAEQATAPEAIKPPADLRFLGVGNGCGIAQAHLEQNFPQQLLGIEPQRYPLAKDMLPPALAAFHSGGAVAAAAALPVYLRDQVTQ